MPSPLKPPTADAELVPFDRSYSTDDDESVARKLVLPGSAPDGDSPSWSQETIWQASKSRVGWLGLFLLGLWGAAFVIDAFEHTLQKNVELAHFVPLIIGQGGNAGSQAVSGVIRALAGLEIEPTPATARRVVCKETAIGAICGLILGAFVFAIGSVLHIVSFHVGVVVAISLPLVSLWANLLGAVLPLLAARLGYNPALTSAPLMTTIIDSSGLLIYFYVAQLYLGSIGHRVDHHHTPHALHMHHHSPRHPPAAVAPNLDVHVGTPG